MAVTLQFVRQADFGSDAIAWFTQGNLSHVDAVMPDGRLFGARSDRVGGRPAGVWPRPPDYAKFALRVRYTLEATPKQEDDFYAFLGLQMGKPYDSSCIWGFVTGRDWRDPSAWICSELQAAALESAKIINPLYVVASKISPDSLALVCSALSTRELKVGE